MKKNYLLLILLLSFKIVIAQHISCNTALEISLNNQYNVEFASNSQSEFPVCTLNEMSETNTPKTKWFKFTATSNQMVTITTNLSVNNSRDTRFHVYTGTCENLICYNGNDDISVQTGNYLSAANFNVFANTTYYIAFDNRWEEDSFVFEFKLTNNPSIPNVDFPFVTQLISFNGQNKSIVDLNGDYLDDIVGVNNTSLDIFYQTNNGIVNKTVIPLNNATYKPSWCITAGDFDRNGINDLMFGAGNGVTIAKANQDGSSYTGVVNQSGIFSQRANFIDINNDGNLDLFVCHDIAPNVYFINNNNNQLTFHQGGLGDVPGGGNYGSIWVDYDNDGDMDLFIAKCRGGNITVSKDELFRNDGNMNFVNVSVAANMDEVSQAWSSAWGDFDNDGYMDAIIGANSFSSGGHKFRRNNGDGTFTDITTGSGWDTYSGGGQEYIAQDFDNDGWIDVMCSNGTIMFNNGDNTFTRKAYNGSDGAIGDLNNDGFLDILDENTILYNIPNNNNWIKFNLQGVTSNRNGIGARIEIYGEFGKQIRDVRSGDGFARMSSLNPHFGIGLNDEITSVVVKWPSGTVDTILNPTINSTLFVLEGSTLGMNESKNTVFNIFPNPAKELISIDFKEPISSFDVEIYDLQGKTVIKSSNSNSIDISKLPIGTYILLVTDQDGNNSSKKFIKK